MLTRSLPTAIVLLLLGARSLSAQLATPPQSGLGTDYSGISGQTSIRIPRLEEEVTIDGALTEPAWSRASVLTGFSEFQPVDGRPAEDSTRVLVWYSPHAIYFGIRAFEAHGAVHATLANRDKIGSDDYVQILLDTFNDHRRALVFGVNPLGVQSDGNLTEGLQTRGGGSAISGPSSGSVRDTADLSADYTYQSKGRLVDYGYEVEIRVPFKSIRYQTVPEQTWSLNVVRRVQHSGYEDSWTPAKRANASFLSQSGTIAGLTGLQRGLVLDMNPAVTSKVTGTRTTPGWNYDASRPQFGGNVRWGVTNNLTLNGTIKPDFSQVEADQQQVTFNPRSAVFYPEKRPFFLEGSETFESPNQLIYSRRVVQPLTAAKLSGKMGSTTIGFLSAVDDQSLSASGTHYPVYNLLRLRRDLGHQSTAGLVYTDKVDGDNYNRVAGVDARIVFAKIYSTTLQGAGSVTRSAGVTKQGPLFNAVFERTGRGLTLRYVFQGFGTDFHAQSGFIARENYASLSFGHRFTFYGKAGARIQSVSLNVPLNATWSQYRNLTHGPVGDLKNDNSVTVRLRGGWQVGALLFPESFKYDPAAYATYAIERHQGATIDTISFTGTNRLPNYDIGASITTPTYSKFDAFLSVLSGQDENFDEWSSSWIWYVTTTVNVRPTPKLRVTASYQLQQYLRRSDMTRVSTRDIPRLKVEYQLSRPIFLRLVSQYDIRWRDSLRDDSRTGFPLLIRNTAGVYQRALTTRSNALRVDWLFSYQPNPGTVIFAGYGSSLTETDAFKFRDLRRTADGFFVKLSYLFKL